MKALSKIAQNIWVQIGLKWLHINTFLQPWLTWVTYYACFKINAKRGLSFKIRHGFFCFSMVKYVQRKIYVFCFVDYFRLSLLCSRYQVKKIGDLLPIKFRLTRQKRTISKGKILNPTTIPQRHIQTRALK